MTEAAAVPDLVQPTPPEIDEGRAARIALEGWGIRATARSLGSNQDRNFLLTRDDAPPLLLKIANPSVGAAELEAQSRAATALAARAETRTPRALPPVDAQGTTVRPVTVDGVALNARVLEFLEGRTLSGYLSPAVVHAMGALAARVALALADFEADGVERAQQWDLRHAPAALAGLLPRVADEGLRRRLSARTQEAWSRVDAVAPELPVQFIHGDLTDDNIVTADAVTRVPDGVIDLGDLDRTWTIGELAITVSSLLHHDGMALPAAMHAVAAYHAVRPISAPEADALWPLVVVRAATLVASAHHVLAADPGNEYAAANLEHEALIFERATSVPLDVATALVLSATGREVGTPSLPEHVELLPGVNPGEVVLVDLSATSPALHEGRWLAASAEDQAWDGCLTPQPSRPAPRAAVARFGEARLTRSAPHAQDEPENVALGVELRFAGSTPVAAPWAGEVVRTPTGLLLEAAGWTLRLDGAAPTRAGSVQAGEVIGSADRLWVQVHTTDAAPPRFATGSMAPGWRSVVADPSALLPWHPPAPGTTDAAALLDRRARRFASVQEHYYDDPPVMVRGWREHLIDQDGRVYLDTLNNVTSVGHAHPRLVAAVSEQWRLLNTNSRFHYPSVVEFSERLAELLPEPLDTVFLVNSGSEAVDLALRLGQAWSGRQDVLAIAEAYHGWTSLTDAVSTSAADNPAAQGTRPAWVHTLPVPNPFRGAHRGAEASRYAEDAVAEIDRLARSGTPVGAFVAETLFGGGGGISLPDGYLDAVYRAVRRHGGLAIADEVQVGYGRLGDWFWGFEQQRVVPDIVAVAKAMGNGHPLGAVVTTREIADAYRAGGYFFSSAGGSPVSSVVGLTVLDIIRDEGLQENARDVGRHLRERLEELGREHPILAAVHGSGFYLGPEFVRDRSTWQPATEETAAICDRLRELGVIAQPTGDHLNILKLKPPMCFSRSSADAFVAALDRVLATGW